MKELIMREIMGVLLLTLLLMMIGCKSKDDFTRVEEIPDAVIARTQVRGNGLYEVKGSDKHHYMVYAGGGVIHAAGCPTDTSKVN